MQSHTWSCSSIFLAHLNLVCLIIDFRMLTLPSFLTPASWFVRWDVLLGERSSGVFTKILHSVVCLVVLHIIMYYIHIMSRCLISWVIFPTIQMYIFNPVLFLHVADNEPTLTLYLHSFNRCYWTSLVCFSNAVHLLPARLVNSCVAMWINNKHKTKTQWKRTLCWQYQHVLFCEEWPHLAALLSA